MGTGPNRGAGARLKMILALSYDAKFTLLSAILFLKNGMRKHEIKLKEHKHFEMVLYKLLWGSMKKKTR